MTFKELLKKQGLTTEQINSVISEMKANDIYTTSLENADERYSKLKTKKEDLENQLNKANTKISDLKQFENDNKDLKAKLDGWEIEKANFEKTIAQKDFDYALDRALEGVKAKNPNIVKSLLKKDELKLVDGKITGLDSQIETIKKENDFLFEKNSGIPNFPTGGKGGENNPPTKSIGEKLAEKVTANTEASKKVDNFFS